MSLDESEQNADTEAAVVTSEPASIAPETDDIADSIEANAVSDAKTEAAGVEVEPAPSSSDTAEAATPEEPEKNTDTAASENEPPEDASDNNAEAAVAQSEPEAIAPEAEDTADAEEADTGTDTETEAAVVEDRATPAANSDQAVEPARADSPAVPSPDQERIAAETEAADNDDENKAAQSAKADEADEPAHAGLKVVPSPELGQASQENEAPAGNSPGLNPPVVSSIDRTPAPESEAVPVIEPLQTPPPAVALKAEDETLNKMIGQMIAVSFAGTEPDDEGVKRVLAQITNGQIGAVLFTKRNIRSVEQLKRLIGTFRGAKAQRLPLLMISHEGGVGQPLSGEKGFSTYPSAGELGQTNDPLNAFIVYQNMAEELKSFGFNVNLGPVLNLEAGQGQATLNGQRSYGSSPKHVTAFAKAFRLAHEQQAIIAAPKYFPGRKSGGGEAESTEDTATTRSDSSVWDATAIEPYRELLADAGHGMVMVGHLMDTEISDNGRMPASLSVKTVQAKLRGEIGFQGVAMAYDLDAPKVAHRFPLDQRVLLSIAAGNDMLMMGGNAVPNSNISYRVVSIVKDALENGMLTRERIKASYDRIIALKRRLAESAKTVASAQRQETKTKDF